MITEAFTPETKKSYPGFQLKASDVSAFIYARPFNVFIYAKDNLGGIEVYKPEDEYSFYCWLKENQIREIPYYV